MVKITTRYAESDQMGYIHHSNHIVYFEMARMKFFYDMGIDVGELEKKDIIIPVVEVWAKYLSPAFFCEDVYVSAKVVEITGAKLKFCHEIKRNNGEKICVGGSTVCFYDKKNKRPIKLSSIFSKEFQEKLHAKIEIEREINWQIYLKESS